MSAIASEEELAFAGPAALADLVRRRELRPRELVELFLARIEAVDPGLNAFRVVLAEQALAAADAAEGSDGPLVGVPIAVKDEMALAGQVATQGSHSYGPPAVHDAEIVRRLRAAGAIPIGITNVPELMIFPWTASDANGITRIPGTSSAPRVDPRVGRRRRSQQGWSQPPPRPTAAVQFVSRPRAADLSG